MSSETATHHYRAFKVRDTVTIPDPDMPQPRYYTMIFIETNEDGSGFVHHVTGDLVTGMQYERRKGVRPEDSASFHSKEHIGYVVSSTYPDAVDEICVRQPAPPRQKAFNPKTMRTDPIKPDGSFYKPGEARQPLIKCTEWIERQAVQALLQANVVIRNNTLASLSP